MVKWMMSSGLTEFGVDSACFGQGGNEHFTMPADMSKRAIETFEFATDVLDDGIEISILYDGQNQ